VSQTQKMRVLVADDHFVLRLGLVTLINDESDMEVVAEAANGQELIDLFRTHRPDVVLMDLRMPGHTGDEVIAAVCAQDPDARIIVLTIHKGDEAVYQALRAGARGYLLKDVPTQEILAAIRSVHAGEQCIPPAIAARVAQRIRKADLSPREVTVVKLIAAGLSNKEIGDRLGVSDATAKKHVTGLLAKLGVRDRTHAVTLSLERGIIDLDDVNVRSRPVPRN
jgi:two-component system, NarL family, response regulator